MGADRDSERTEVSTYVPRYQKEVWREHADDLGMSQSEFVRTMVQAGRRGFQVDNVEPSSPDTAPRGGGLESRVLAVLETEGTLSWDELVDAVSGDFEDRLEEALDTLQRENVIQYRGRRGGYTVVSDGR